VARQLATRLAETWAQGVVIENQGGAGGVIGAANVAKAAPDGYTLIMVGINHAINPSLYKDVPYDTMRDFKAIVRVALAPLAILTGVRAVRAARRDPARHGGRRTAAAGLALGSAVAIGVGGILVAGVPRAIENRREASLAATRAEMYHMAGLIQRYHEVYGAYPDRVSDLSRVEGVASVPDSRDSWDHRIIYSGYTSDIASSGAAPPLNVNFELRSPGPDGVPNTPDDLIMRDGAIVDASGAVPSLPVTVPVTRRVR